MASAWEKGRPVYQRLPGAEEKYRYANPPVADWLTTPIDENLMAVKSAIASFYPNYLDPATAIASNLDWLAQLCGFTGEYWETSWTQTQKRTLIANSFNVIWATKGSRSCLEFILNTLGLSYKIYITGEFLAGKNTAGSTVGGQSLEYFLLLPLLYLRTSDQWRLANKINRLYSPVYVRSLVCFSQFYAGFSAAGEPVFDATIKID